MTTPRCPLKTNQISMRLVVMSATLITTTNKSTYFQNSVPFGSGSGSDLFPSTFSCCGECIAKPALLPPLTAPRSGGASDYITCDRGYCPPVVLYRPRL